MSRTNCFLPNNGFCLNFRVRMVNSNIASEAICEVLRRAVARIEPGQVDLSQIG